jgi:transposase InsO family protein
MHLTETYPIQRVCQVLDYPRSSFYVQHQPDNDADLRTRIEQVLNEFPTYGYRRVTEQLGRTGPAVNSKRVRRVLHAMGLVQRKRPKTQRTTNSRHGFLRYPNLVFDLAVMQPEQVWVADITYIHLHTEFVYLAVLMDVFTRSIRGWQLSRGLDVRLSLTALERALAQGIPEIHHSDQGIQYAAPEYVQRLERVGVHISMAMVGEATQNGYAERLMRTIKEEEVNLSDYRDFQDAYQQLGRFLDDVYMRKRIHSSLGYLTPVEFETQWRAQQPTRSGVLP